MKLTASRGYLNPWYSSFLFHIYRKCPMGNGLSGPIQKTLGISCECERKEVNCSLWGCCEN